MSPHPERKPADKPITLNVTPLSHASEDALGRKPGRPKKTGMPPMPALTVTPLEKEMYDYFISAYLQEYPDLTPSDKIVLQLAGVVYIEIWRTSVQELESGQVITMARQDLYARMRGLLDSMAVTRKQRQKTQPVEDPQAEVRDQLRELFG